MVDYLLNGLQIFLLGVGLLVLLNNAPARLRLWLSVVALGATLTPWHLLPALHVPFAVYQESGFVVQSLVVTSAGSDQTSSLTTWTVVVAMLATGLFGFAAIVVRQVVRLRHWRSIAQRNDALLELAPTQTPRDCRVWVIPHSKEAGTTALPHSEIWIGDYFLKEQKLSTVVTHEACHVISNDPRIEWVLVLTRSLFWWHPLAWFWVWQARRQMELACDERCAIELGQREYQTDLAELVQDINIFQGGVAMVASKSFNVARIRKLAKTPLLLKRHRAGVLIAILAAALSVVNLQASPNIQSSAESQHFKLCPSDVETSSVASMNHGGQLKMKLSVAAADRLQKATEGAIGNQLVLVDANGTSLEDISLTIRAPLHKHIQLVLDSEQSANALHSYFESDKCEYE